MTDAQREELNQHNIPVYDSPIQSIESDNGMVQQVVLKDGTSIGCTGIFFRPKLMIGSGLPQAIGCELTETGAVIIDNLGKTNVSGVYSAGDAATHLHQAIIAASMGSLAGVGINNELNEEEWRNI